MKRIAASQSNEKIRRLFAPLEFNLAVGSILAGETPGSLFVDDPVEPHVGLAWYRRRVFLTGDPNSPGGARELAEVLSKGLLAPARQSGLEVFILHAHPDGWQEHLKAFLPGLQPIFALREHYTCSELKEDWRPLLPRGFELRPVDGDLLTQPGLQGVEGLLEEMASERPTVEDFLQRSFGVCLVREREGIIGWCLSEYNLNDRCEVGVAVGEPFRLRGLGTAMTLAFVELALQRGYREIGWHCWKRNLPSGALARRAGFTLERAYPVYLYQLAG